jgi:hypothetical protein
VIYCTSPLNKGHADLTQPVIRTSAKPLTHRFSPREHYIACLDISWSYSWCALLTGGPSWPLIVCFTHLKYLNRQDNNKHFQLELKKAEASAWAQGLTAPCKFKSRTQTNLNHLRNQSKSSNPDWTRFQVRAIWSKKENLIKIGGLQI